MTSRKTHGFWILSFLVLAVVFGIPRLHHFVHAQASSPSILSVDWSPDGTKIAAGDTGGVVKVWDANSSDLLITIQAGEDDWPDVLFVNVTSVHWSPDNISLAIGIACGNPMLGFVQILNTDSGQKMATIASENSVNSVAWSPDGSKLAAGGRQDTGLRPEGWIRVWDTFDYDLIADLKQGNADNITQVAWSPDGTRLASSAYDETGYDNNVIVWDASTWTAAITLDHSDFVSTVAWSPDGTRLVTAGRYLAGRIWDAESGVSLMEFPFEFQEPFRGIYYISWSPQSNAIISLGSNNLLFGDATSGKLIDRIYTSITSANFAWCPNQGCILYGAGSIVRKASFPSIDPLIDDPEDIDGNP